MTSQSNDSEFLRHEPCPACGSSDAFAVYSSGFGYCYSCHHKARVEEGELEEEQEELPKEFLRGDHVEIKARRLDAKTCRLHGYHVADWKGKKVQVADYRDPKSGAVVAQKIRTAGKEFCVLGDGKGMPLWNQHRHRDKGRAVLVTEGEIDCMVFAQLQGNRWPCVSVPNGAGGAEAVFRRQIEWLESFEKVVICFDNDEPGQQAAEACAKVLSPGKAFIMRVPEGHKDICDAYLAGQTEDLVNAFWSAKAWRPDGIVAGDEFLHAILEDRQVESTPYPWKSLNDKLLGLRMRELVTVTAGTGTGKSLVCRALAAHLIRSGKKVGYISLEESLARTGLGLLQQFLGRPLHISREGISDAELQAAFDEHLRDRVCVFNHFGSLDAENLLARCKFMRIAEGCDFLIVDHLSILVSGWDSSDGDERRLIDNVMTALRSTVEQTDCGMILVSHLKRLDGRSRSHEEGGKPRLSHLRGSHSIAQLSDAVIGLSRDQQSKDSNWTHLSVLKNRFAGLTGDAGCLHYDAETGLLVEAEPEFSDESGGESDF